MNFPQELLYTEDHEYCKVNDDVVTIGVTEYAQEQLGDITYVELPEVGDSFTKGDSLGVIEAVKAASDIYSPVSGEVVEINEKLEDNPELVNSECYEGGWIIKLKLSDPSELDGLMKADAYTATID
ncbi:MAG: glycine cleavage system protein GcvH [Candidatus Delongbacteria bacterium]|jgi:glycine cleavage system H protein|nr:glycine cleavage system protein GcvH [Candidatus Delongbacteria bacterium]